MAYPVQHFLQNHWFWMKNIEWIGSFAWASFSMKKTCLKNNQNGSVFFIRNRVLFVQPNKIIFTCFAKCSFSFLIKISNYVEFVKSVPRRGCPARNDFMCKINFESRIKTKNSKWKWKLQIQNSNENKHSKCKIRKSKFNDECPS